MPYALYNDQLNPILAGTEQYDIVMVMGSNLAACIAKDALVDKYKIGVDAIMTKPI